MGKFGAQLIHSRDIVHQTSCLRHLLPPIRHNPQMAKLLQELRLTSYDIPFARTNVFKTCSSFLHCISTFNLLPQFTQFTHYPPLVFYHFVAFYICGCIYVYFNSFLMYFIVCISSPIFVWVEDTINGCIYKWTCEEIVTNEAAPHTLTPLHAYPTHAKLFLSSIGDLQCQVDRLGLGVRINFWY